MVKKRICLNEGKLKGIIRESIKRIISESGYNQFSDYDFASVDPYGEDDGFGDNHGYGRLDGYWTFNGAYVNISDIDGVVEFEIKPRCEGCKGSFKIVGKEADRLKREIEDCVDEYGDISVAIWNCVKDMVRSGGRLNESMLKDYNEFDNVPDDFVESLDGQYYEVTVPDWCLPYLVNGDKEGYTEEEIGMMDNFIDSFNGKLWYGLNVGDACVPMDGVSPSFCSSNDVGGDACDCYRFCLPMKEAERSGVDGELNETRLKRLIRESIKDVLNEGMVMPNRIERVWVSNGDKDSFIVYGNGRYYHVYPSYHDSFDIETDSEIAAKEKGKLIEKAFSNKGIPCTTGIYNDCLYVEILDWGKYNNEYDDALISWCGKNGLRYKDETYGTMFFEIMNHSDEISPARLSKLLNGYVEVTDRVRPHLTGDSINDGRSLGVYLNSVEL